MSGIYAIGDVTKKNDTATMAARAGAILAERLFNGKRCLKLNTDVVPMVIFSQPPVGTCGLQYKDAIEKYGEDKVRVFKSEFTDMYYNPVDDQYK